MGNIQKINRLHRTQYGNYTYVSIILWFVIFLLAYVSDLLVMIFVPIVFGWLSYSSIKAVSIERAVEFQMILPVSRREFYTSIFSQYYLYNALYLILSFSTILMNHAAYMKYFFQMFAVFTTTIFCASIIIFGLYISYIDNILNIKNQVLQKLLFLIIEILSVVILFTPTYFFVGEFLENNIPVALAFMAVSITFYSIAYYIIYRISVKRKIPLHILGDS